MTPKPSTDNWLESMLSWLSPSLLVRGTEWEAEWRERERSSFLAIARVASPIVALIYMAHYYLYDVPMGLEPLSDWFALRISVSISWLACFAFYLSPARNGKFYKAPLLAAAVITCYSQAIATLWYGEETWIFGFILVITATTLLRTSVLKSLAFVLVVVLLQSTVYLQTELSIPDILTGTLVSLAVTMILRSSSSGEMKYFLLNKEVMTAQQRIAELNSDIAERIRAFIPRVIADRISSAIEEDRRTVIEATIDVLEPKNRRVACLYSDIRGFTENSNSDIDAFLGRSVIPEIKACSEAIEVYRGVPRKIGDLVFAYFDGEDQKQNVLSAILAAFNIARLNRDMNETYAEVEVQRYILISAGHALVGNVGGLDSSVEITALGPPVNYLSRLDEVSKRPQLRQLIQSGDILLSDDCLSVVPELAETTIETIELSDLGLNIRDFPEAKRVHRMPATATNLGRIREIASPLEGIDDKRNRSMGKTYQQTG